VNTGLVPRFEQYLQAHSLSLATIRNYLADLRAFVRWQSLRSGLRITRADFTAYREHLCNETNHLPTTVNRRLQSLRLFGRFLFEIGHADENLAGDIELLRHSGNGNEHSPRTLDGAEIARLSNAIRSGRPSLTQRDFAIMQMMLNAGLRVHEIAELRMSDIIRTNRGMKVAVHENGNGARVVPLNHPATRALRDYLDVRPAIPTIEQVFVSQRGQPLSLRSVQRLIDNYAHAAGLDGVSAQMLRHTCAKNLLARTGNARRVDMLLGHHNVKVLDRYSK
jgi:site-specific recombinase XerD